MHDVVYRVVVRLTRLLFRALGLRIEVHHAERLPATGPVVVAANHVGFLDFMVVGLPADERGRLVRFLAKEAVFRSRLSGPLMRAMHHVPVDRRHGVTAALRARRALLAGEVVGVFPEATISHAVVPKELGDLRRGAAHLALTAGAPLVPVAHWGVHRVLTIGGRWSLRRGRWVGVDVGEPLLPEPGESAEELTARLHAALVALVDGLLDRYPDDPDRRAGAWWWPGARGGGAPVGEEARRLDAEAVAVADGTGVTR